VIDEAFAELRPLVRTKRACQLVGKPRATHYRRLRPCAVRERRPRRAPANALTGAERQAVLDALHRPGYADLPPAQVWARLLDEGTYLASVSTMYRLLRASGESRDRRRQRTHPARTKPQLLARGPNEVWSWDLTKLPGPGRHEFYELYAVIDIFSRYVPGWLVAPAESAELAEAFIADTIARNGVAPRSLHADRGSSMTSKPVAQLLVDLGVARSHSRPHVSNDNPFSEANFKTLKYFPDFPGRFGSIHDARAFCEQFFGYYNHEHRHGALGLHTPASVHFGTATEIRASRAVVLDAAYAANPTRFAKPPTPPRLPTAAWINEPTPEALIQTKR
jgi:putative transposase